MDLTGAAGPCESERSKPARPETRATRGRAAQRLSVRRAITRASTRADVSPIRRRGEKASGEGIARATFSYECASRSNTSGSLFARSTLTSQPESRYYEAGAGIAVSSPLIEEKRLERILDNLRSGDSNRTEPLKAPVEAEPPDRLVSHRTTRTARVRSPDDGQPGPVETPQADSARTESS